MLPLQRLYLLMSSIAHILYFILGILTCYIILCYNCSYYYVRHVETQKARKTQFITQFFIQRGIRGYKKKYYITICNNLTDQ